MSLPSGRTSGNRLDPVHHACPGLILLPGGDDLAVSGGNSAKATATSSFGVTWGTPRYTVAGQSGGVMSLSSQIFGVAGRCFVR